MSKETQNIMNEISEMIEPKRSYNEIINDSVRALSNIKKITINEARSLICSAAKSFNNEMLTSF